jgi:hypothetical protein
MADARRGRRVHRGHFYLAAAARRPSAARIRTTHGAHRDPEPARQPRPRGLKGSPPPLTRQLCRTPLVGQTCRPWARTIWPSSLRFRRRSAPRTVNVVRCRHGEQDSKFAGLHMTLRRPCSGQASQTEYRVPASPCLQGSDPEFRHAGEPEAGFISSVSARNLGRRWCLGRTGDPDYRTAGPPVHRTADFPAELPIT